jgi:hypothetical protein
MAAANGLPPPSQAASRLRSRGRRRCNDAVGRIIIIDDMTGMPLAADIIGEQAPNIRKAGDIPQKVAPSPGSAISFVSSAHHVTRSGCPQPASRNFILGLKYDGATTKTPSGLPNSAPSAAEIDPSREDDEDPRAKVRRPNVGFIVSNGCSTASRHIVVFRRRHLHQGSLRCEHRATGSHGPITCRRRF